MYKQSENREGISEDDSTFKIAAETTERAGDSGDSLFEMNFHAEPAKRGKTNSSTEADSGKSQHQGNALAGTVLATRKQAAPAVSSAVAPKRKRASHPVMPAAPTARNRCHVIRNYDTLGSLHHQPTTERGFLMNFQGFRLSKHDMEGHKGNAVRAELASSTVTKDPAAATTLTPKVASSPLASGQAGSNRGKNNSTAPATDSSKVSCKVTPEEEAHYAYITDVRTAHSVSC
ncbi:hypothetical protein HDU89_005638 [Geranomyces variabilis]|nr:hypothetical protein HDU89_005638 [Geranomyces variabilis]